MNLWQAQSSVSVYISMFQIIVFWEKIYICSKSISSSISNLSTHLNTFQTFWGKRKRIAVFIKSQSAQGSWMSEFSVYLM